MFISLITMGTALFAFGFIFGYLSGKDATKPVEKLEPETKKERVSAKFGRNSK